MLQISCVGAAVLWIDGDVWEGGTLRESYACSNERMEGEEYRGGDGVEQGGVKSDCRIGDERKRHQYFLSLKFT